MQFYINISYFKCPIVIFRENLRMINCKRLTKFWLSVKKFLRCGLGKGLLVLSVFRAFINFHGNVQLTSASTYVLRTDMEKNPFKTYQWPCVPALYQGGNNSPDLFCLQPHLKSSPAGPGPDREGGTAKRPGQFHPSRLVTKNFG